jgi:tetratricopeptide (TPR) repeat protein
MKYSILVFAFSLFSTVCFTQDRVESKKLVDQGVQLHDNGDYNAAITKYDQALALDKDNLLALAEKAFSLFSLGKYDESIVNCRRAIETHPGDMDLKTVYVTYGNALDASKMTEQSLRAYDEGIKLFPGYYQLYFNKGISQTGVGDYDSALLNFQQAVMLNPNHASSHNVIARICKAKNKSVPAILAYCRFLVIESKSDRATDNLASIQELLGANLTQKDDKSVTINLSSDMLNTKKSGKNPENDFSSAEMLMSMSTALDFDKKFKDETAVVRLTRKLESLFAIISETKKGEHGFFWEYYSPYFIEMYHKKMVTVFAHLVLAPSGNEDVTKWVGDHAADVQEFNTWSLTFSWKTN